MIITALKLSYSIITLRQPYLKYVISNQVIYAYLISKWLQMQKVLFLLKLKPIFCLLRVNFKPPVACLLFWPLETFFFFFVLDSGHCSGLSLRWQILGKLFLLPLFSGCWGLSSNIFQLKKNQHQQRCSNFYKDIQEKFAFGENNITAVKTLGVIYKATHVLE